MKNLTFTLNLLERLQQEVEKTAEERPDELFFNLGINYLHSMIERIVSKINRKSRDENYIDELHKVCEMLLGLILHSPHTIKLNRMIISVSKMKSSVHIISNNNNNNNNNKINNNNNNNNNNNSGRSCQF